MIRKQIRKQKDMGSMKGSRKTETAKNFFNIFYLWKNKHENHSRIERKTWYPNVRRSWQGVQETNIDLCRNRAGGWISKHYRNRFLWWQFTTCRGNGYRETLHSEFQYKLQESRKMRRIQHNQRTESETYWNKCWNNFRLIRYPILKCIVFHF